MDDISEGPILTRKDGDLHYVVLNRPERLNAIDGSMFDAFMRVMPAVDRDPDTKVVILTGAGRGFCSGGDLKASVDRYHVDNARTLLETPRVRVVYPSVELVYMFLNLEKPSIAMVNGPAAGLGANIALFTDVVIMAEEAVIGDTHVNAGLVAGDGGAVIWPLLVGLSRAKEFLMTGRLLTGPEAHRAGLVSQCVPLADLEAATRAQAEAFTRQPQYAMRATKVVVNKIALTLANLLLDTSSAYEHISKDQPERVTALENFGRGGAPT